MIQKSEADVQRERARLMERYQAIEIYREHCIKIEDHHGVQDASSDLREIDAALHTLDWIEGKTDIIGV